jgi:flagellar export protein FliJ
MSRQVKPFTLDVVLNYRKRLEDIAQQRFVEAKRIRETIRQKLISEEDTFSKLCAESYRLQAEGITVAELIRYEERINYLQKSVKAIRKTLAEKEEIVATEQKNLARRSKERQVMERLKEQQNSQWGEYLSRKEASMLDEISVIRHNAEPL